MAGPSVLASVGLRSNWIAGVEYLYASFDRQDFFYNGLTSVELSTSTPCGRASATFNWATPVVAKY
jgi:hypothetical protein